MLNPGPEMTIYKLRYQYKISQHFRQQLVLAKLQISDKFLISNPISRLTKYVQRMIPKYLSILFLGFLPESWTFILRAY